MAKNRFRKLMISLLAASMPLVVGAAQAPPIADATINSDKPNKNLGKDQDLIAGKNNTALIGFDLSTLPVGSTGDSVTRAILLVWVNKIGFPGGSIEIIPVTSPWSEEEVTFASKPSFGLPLTTLSVLDKNQYVTVDVTAQVKDWLNNPGSNFGLAIKQPTGGPSTVITFDSKENKDTSHAPMIDITLTGTAVGCVTAEELESVRIEANNARATANAALQAANQANACCEGMEYCCR